MRQRCAPRASAVRPHFERFYARDRCICRASARYFVRDAQIRYAKEAKDILPLATRKMIIAMRHADMRVIARKERYERLRGGTRRHAA